MIIKSSVKLSALQLSPATASRWARQDFFGCAADVNHVTPTQHGDLHDAMSHAGPPYVNDARPRPHDHRTSRLGLDGFGAKSSLTAKRSQLDY